MKHLTRNALFVAALVFCGHSNAEDNLWFGVKAGTLGLGAEVAWRPIDWLDVRAGGNLYDYEDSADYGGIEYDGNLALDNYYVTGNLHFPLSPLRLTIGAYQNNNEIQLSSQDATSFLLGNNPVPYTQAQVGTLTGTAGFDSIAPYIGAGFDFDLINRLGVSLDFGLLWQGEPTLSMIADGILANDPAFIVDLNAEMAEVQSELDDLKAYPAVSVGFHFNFL